ncbi:hypothetical protein FRC02_000521 [Tulasnella sp. 418]|nr:hypothetical protein FRC02_000521 [Tulasnella sp. 418]
MSQSNASPATYHSAPSSSQSRRSITNHEGLLHPLPGNNSVAARLAQAGYVVLRDLQPLTLDYQMQPQENDEDPRQGQVHNNFSHAR